MSETQAPAPNEEKKATDFMQLYELEQQDKVIETAKIAYGVLGWEFPQDRAEQYELTNKIIEDFTRANLPTGDADEYGRVPVRRMNIYTDTKGIHLVTVDIHEGTTPLILRHPDNGVNMKSLCYLVPQDVQPQGEWYKPIPEVIATMPKELQKHCYDGGLILRRYGTKAQEIGRAHV